MIIAIDFDGTIADTDWPEIIGPVPGALEGIRELHALDHTLLLNTCREGRRLTEARLWLNLQKVSACFSGFNENLSQKIELYGDCRKLGADIYIDDRNACGPLNAGGLVDWEKVLEFVKIVDQ